MEKGTSEVATLGGGCFWCLEAVYQEVEGVQEVVSGYAGGDAATAHYKAVCSGSTQHAEVVQLTFDPAVISFAEILEIFWTIHDPTTLNRQGHDRGPQYRSVIFYHDAAQKEIAEQLIREIASKLYDDPVVTELSPFPGFWEAEAHHQDYYRKVGNRNPYCSVVISPKVQKLRKKFKERLKKSL